MTDFTAIFGENSLEDLFQALVRFGRIPADIKNRLQYSRYHDLLVCSFKAICSKSIHRELLGTTKFSYEKKRKFSIINDLTVLLQCYGNGMQCIGIKNR